MTFAEAATKVEKADKASQLFGVDPTGEYRNLAKLLHPDVAEPKNKARAENAFAKLSALHSSLNGKKPAESVATVIGKWLVTDLVASGDIAEVYRCSRIDKPDEFGVFKIARSPKDGDLIENENFSLKFLAETTGLENFKRYLPSVLATMDASGRRANVLTVPEEGVSLAEILRLVPSLDFRHVVWMMNRSLSVLGFAHRSGLIHGAVLPEHLLFGPSTHSLNLVDWCYSVTAESKRHIPAIVPQHKAHYPPEVTRKKAYPSTDLFMLFSIFKNAPGIAIPKLFKPLFDLCLLASPVARPADAWEVQDRWLGLAEKEYGPAKYLELKIPIN